MFRPAGLHRASGGRWLALKALPLVLLLGVLPSPLMTACIVAIRQALTT